MKVDDIKEGDWVNIVCQNLAVNINGAAQVVSVETDPFTACIIVPEGAGSGWAFNRSVVPQKYNVPGNTFWLILVSEIIGKVDSHVKSVPIIIPKNGTMFEAAMEESRAKSRKEDESRPSNSPFEWL